MHSCMIPYDIFCVTNKDFTMDLNFKVPPGLIRVFQRLILCGLENVLYQILAAEIRCITDIQR